MDPRDLIGGIALERRQAGAQQGEELDLVDAAHRSSGLQQLKQVTQVDSDLAVGGHLSDPGGLLPPGELADTCPACSRW